MDDINEIISALEKQGGLDDETLQIISAIKAKDAGSISANKNNFLENMLARAKFQGVKALNNGVLETTGMMGGGLAGGLLGAAEGGIGAIPASVAGSALGAAGGKNIEDIILSSIGFQKNKSAKDQMIEDVKAGMRGAVGEMTGQGVGKVATKVGKGLIETVAPRLMTATVKDADLAAGMLKRDQWGTNKSLYKQGQEGVLSLSGKIDDALKDIKGPIDRTKIIDHLEELRKEYAKLPGRDAETTAIEELQKKIFQQPPAWQLKKGVTNYQKLSAPEANQLKRDIYSENKKLYSSGNFDPASIRAQTDMKVAKGLKESVEEVAPEVKALNKDLGHHLQLRDTAETLLTKDGKANLIQLRPLLAGLGLLSQGVGAASAAPFAMQALGGSTWGRSGAAVLMKNLGKILRGGPAKGAGTKIMTDQVLRQIGD